MEIRQLRNKIIAIKNALKTNYSIHPVLVTTYGLSDEMYSGIIQYTHANCLGETSFGI